MAGPLRAALLVAGALALLAVLPAPSRAEGFLRHGVQLPAASFDFVTWDPVLKRTPNRGWRRWGTRKLVDTTQLVLRAYHDAHPDAPRVLVGDLSRRHGGFFGARAATPEAVPEPSTAAVLVGGLAFLLACSKLREGRIPH